MRLCNTQVLIVLAMINIEHTCLQMGYLTMYFSLCASYCQWVCEIDTL